MNSEGSDEGRWLRQTTVRWTVVAMRGGSPTGKGKDAPLGRDACGGTAAAINADCIRFSLQ